MGGLGKRRFATWEQLVKKGRHRRYEEARQAKRAFNAPLEKCEECGGDSERGHASWCLVSIEEIDDDEELEAKGAYPPTT